ncbi:hypothetical protein CPA56_08455 [Bombella sp. TMW2.1889]|uniref:Uncharacterized protein n=1 Tax=Bombella mellum TaxID=2039288 RepID=A0ABR5ZUM6_9PROT|nr:hypothetical protein [Bombella mellum]
MQEENSIPPRLRRQKTVLRDYKKGRHMQRKGLSHEGNLLIGQIISVMFTVSQYFSDGNTRFGLPD